MEAGEVNPNKPTMEVGEETKTQMRNLHINNSNRTNPGMRIRRMTIGVIQEILEMITKRVAGKVITKRNLQSVQTTGTATITKVTTEKDPDPVMAMPKGTQEAVMVDSRDLLVEVVAAEEVEEEEEQVPIDPLVEIRAIIRTQTMIVDGEIKNLSKIMLKMTGRTRIIVPGE